MAGEQNEVKIEPDLDILEYPGTQNAYNFGDPSPFEDEISGDDENTSSKTRLAIEVVKDYSNDSSHRLNYSAVSNSIGIFIKIEECTGKQIYTCRMCFENYDHWSVLHEHMYNKHQIMCFTCIICSKLVKFKDFEHHVFQKHDAKFASAKKATFKGVKTGCNPCSTDLAIPSSNYSMLFSKTESKFNVKIEKTPHAKTDFRCQICQQDKTAIEEFQSHLVDVHSARSKMKCEVCEAFVLLEDILQHFTTNHSTQDSLDFSSYTCFFVITKDRKGRKCLRVSQLQKKTMECFLCKSSLKDVTSVCKHLAIAHTVIAFECFHCMEILGFNQLENHTSLEDCQPSEFHFLQNPSKGVVLELKWLFVFSKENDQQQHFITKVVKTAGKSDIFECEICDLRFDLLDSYQRHTVDQHFSQQLYTCSSCSKVLCSGDLHRHFNSHITYKPIVFKSSHYYHFSVVKESEQVFIKVTVTGGNPKSNVCEICGDSFWYAHTLQKHMYGTHRIRCYRCTRCQKDVLFNYFKEHIENYCISFKKSVTSHFRCTEEKAAPTEFSYKIFQIGVKESLKVTVVPKTAAKSQTPFTCYICSCSYKMKQVFLNHLQKTHLLKEMQCLVCKEQTNVDILESHPIRHSSNLIHFDAIDIGLKIVYSISLEEVFTNQTTQLSITCNRDALKASDTLSCCYCETSFTSKESFLQHISKKHDFKIFSCPKCTLQMKCPDILKHLHEVHVIEVNNEYIFQNCSYPTEVIIPDNVVTKKTLVKSPPTSTIVHSPGQVVVKKEPMESSSIEVPSKSKLVPVKFKTLSVSYLNMFLGYAEDFLKKCSVEGKSKLCLKLCKDPMNQKTFKCEICQLYLKGPISLKMHISTHSKEDSFSCNVCFSNFKLLDIVAGKHRHDNESFVLTLHGDIHKPTRVVPTITNKSVKKEWNYNIVPAAHFLYKCEDFLKDRLCVNIKFIPGSAHSCKICNLFNVSDISRHVQTFHYPQQFYFCQRCKCKVAFEDFASHAERHSQNQVNFISLSEYSENAVCFNTKFVMGAAKDVLKYTPANLADRFCVSVRRVSDTVDDENSCTICTIKLKSKNVRQHLDMHFPANIFFCKKCRFVHFFGFEEFRQHLDIAHRTVKCLEFVSNYGVTLERIRTADDFTNFLIEVIDLDNSGSLCIKAKVNKNSLLICVLCSSLTFESIDELFQHIGDYHMGGSYAYTIFCNLCRKNKPKSSFISHFKMHYLENDLDKCYMNIFKPLKRSRKSPESSNEHIKKFKKDSSIFSVSYDYSEEHDQCLTMEIHAFGELLKAELFDCKICQNHYAHLNELESHLLSDHFPFLSIICLKCYASFNSLDGMVDHIQEEHPTDDSTYLFKVFSKVEEELTDGMEELIVPETVLKQEPVIEDYSLMIPMTMIFVKEEVTE